MQSFIDGNPTGKIEELNLQQTDVSKRITEAFRGGADEVRLTSPPKEYDSETKGLTNMDFWNKLIDIEQKLDRIFGKSVLIDGKWVNL